MLYCTYSKVAFLYILVAVSYVNNIAISYGNLRNFQRLNKQNKAERFLKHKIGDLSERGAYEEWSHGRERVP